MTGPSVPGAAGIDEIRTVLEDVASKVSQLVGRQPPQRLLSKRQGAALLGVSRGRTLDRLIRTGAIRAVQVGSRVRIPMAEIERITVEGAPDQMVRVLAVRRSAARRLDHRPPNMAEELAKARALKVSDL